MPGFPRTQIKAWENSIYRGRISFWFANIEIEYGQTLNGRLGSAGPWLVKSNLCIPPECYTLFLKEGHLFLKKCPAARIDFRVRRH